MPDRPLLRLTLAQRNATYHIYRKISNIKRTKSQNLNVSRLVLQMSKPIYWSKIENEDVVGVAPTILLPIKVRLILEI